MLNGWVEDENTLPRCRIERVAYKTLEIKADPSGNAFSAYW